MDVHSASNTSATYAHVDDAYHELDMSGILSSIASGDYVGISLTQADGASGVRIHGIHFKYS